MPVFATQLAADRSAGSHSCLGLAAAGLCDAALVDCHLPRAVIFPNQRANAAVTTSQLRFDLDLIFGRHKLKSVDLANDIILCVSNRTALQETVRVFGALFSLLSAFVADFKVDPTSVCDAKHHCLHFVLNQSVRQSINQNDF